LKKAFFISVFVATLLLSACAPQTSPGGSTPATPTASATQGTPVNNDLLLWERSGGIAGICQYMTISKDGKYLLEDCKSSTSIAEGQLSPDQLTQLMGMVEQFGPTTWNVKNPPNSADMFNDSIKLFTTGTVQPSEADMEELNTFISNLVTSLTGGTTSDSGIEGKVTIGPTCPGPARPDDPACADKPFQATIKILDSGSALVSQVQSDANGDYRAQLQPGTYIVDPQPGESPMQRAQQQTVSVMAGQYTRVDIQYDSGIR
jgi:hypothetical protein